jgi:hypothetical protein
MSMRLQLTCRFSAESAKWVPSLLRSEFINLLLDNDASAWHILRQNCPGFTGHLDSGPVERDHGPWFDALKIKPRVLGGAENA